MADALLCQKCGGPLGPAAAHRVVTCDFCGTASAPAPKVVERVVDRVIVASPGPEEGGALRCPRCATGLHEHRANDGRDVVRSCIRCAGLWLENATVERLITEFGATIDLPPAFQLALAPPTPTTRQALIHCPTCRAEMKRVTIPETIHYIDVCRAHGTWFDREELPMMVSVHRRQREGELSDEDLRAAGLPGGDSTTDGDGGFFTDLFRSLRALV